MSGHPSELTRLADAASQRCCGSAVAVIRGFDGLSRRRAATLRVKLTRRGVRTIDITPMTTTLRRRRAASGTTWEDRHIGLVVDASATGEEAQRLAAELGVPVLRSKTNAEPAHSALGVFADDALVAVALHGLAAVPLDEQQCQLALARNDDPECLTTGTVRFELAHPQVGRAEHITVTSTHRVTSTQPIMIAPHWGPWILHIDGAPLRPLVGPVEIRCLVDRIQQLTA
jgi:hypothetical protein